MTQHHSLVVDNLNVAACMANFGCRYTFACDPETSRVRVLFAADADTVALYERLVRGDIFEVKHPVSLIAYSIAFRKRAMRYKRR